MATAREIKDRISAVKNIKKITETMEKIATAKIKKATDRLTGCRDYYYSLVRLMSHLISYLKEEGAELDHPLTQERSEVKNSLVFIVSSNRGLCGGYNNNVLFEGKKLYNKLKDEGKNVKLVTVGKKAVSYFKFNRIELFKSFTDVDEGVPYEKMVEISNEFINSFSTDEADEIYLVYTKYYSAARQRPVVEKILPFEVEEVDEEEQDEEFRSIYLFEPDVYTVLNEILPMSIRVKMFNIVLEATLAEQIARKIAMKQASDSAGDMINDLTRVYNRARQSKITKELIEIMGSAKGLKE